jgi:hypothetical protein
MIPTSLVHIQLFESIGDRLLTYKQHIPKLAMMAPNTERVGV